MLISTSTAIEERPVAQYLGVVAGYEKELRHGREEAMAEMTQQAEAVGADAVVGADIDYDTVSGSMLTVRVAHGQ